MTSEDKFIRIYREITEATELTARSAFILRDAMAEAGVELPGASSVAVEVRQPAEQP